MKEQLLHRAGGMRRRAFLGAAGAAVAGPWVVGARALGADGARAASDRIGVASIGIRNMGGGHLGALVHNRDAQVVAVCDVDYGVLEAAEKTVQKAYGEAAGCFATRDFREVLDRRDVDAAVLAVPDHWHVPMAIAACKAGKDVYCEKPLSLTIPQGQAMVRTVRRYGRVFQTGTQRRSSATVRHVCELVRNGRIGRVTKVTCGVGGWNRECGPTWQSEPVPPELDYEMWLGPAPWAPYHPLRCHYSFRFVMDYSGGQLTNNGAHWSDVVQWGLGADGSGPVEVEGTCDWPRTGLFTVPRNIHVTATYAGGAQVHFTDSGGEPKFYGTEGWIDSGNRSDPLSIARSEVGPDEVRLYRSAGSHMDNFLACVRTRHEPAAPVEVGHRSATVCHLGVIAMRLGRKVRWDPAAEQFVDDPVADRLLNRAMRSPWGI
ncbi:MAG TPA: Gfo/Idh/MocA family oxidoreductase [Phycisphaerae bacterium]|nr:Gfo/Idh/MocA family oxidoreductase [Phycisphaerae bacterium]